jgi:hypothetical protein
MNRKIIYILLGITGSMLLTSRSCGPDETTYYQEDRSSDRKEYVQRQIKNEFESDYISEEKLLVYEEKAKQKLQDLADLLSLYSIKNTDSIFRQQISSMVYSLFYKKTAYMKLSLETPHAPADQIANIHQLMDDIDKSEYASMTFQVEGLKILEPLHREHTDYYTGKIGFQFRISGIDDHDTVMIYKNPCYAGIIATRINKKFGNDTELLIWQVFLSRIVGTP